MTQTAAGGGRPLRADALQNRRRILEAAGEVFVEQGPAAPLEEVSRRAGTGIATLYRRFRDRRSLMRAVVLDVLERTYEAAREAIAEESDAFAALVRYMHRTVDLRTAAIIPALLEEVSLDDEEMVRVQDQGTRLLQRMIDEAHRAGALRPEVTFADVGMLIIRMSRPLPGRLSRELNDSLAHRHLDLAINGIRVAAGVPAEIGGPALTLDDLHRLPRPAHPGTEAEPG